MTPNKRQGKNFRISGLVVGIGLGAALTWGGNLLLSATDTDSQTTPTTPVVSSDSINAQSVTIAAVTLSELTQTLEATGTVAAYELIRVFSQAMGLSIESVLVEEGEWVEQGQLLVQLDDSVLQAQLAQAQASVAEAEARVAELEAGTRKEEVARAQASVASAIAQVEQAESDLELAQKRTDRNQDLEAEGAIARDYLDQILNEQRSKESALLQAQANLREAQQNLAELEAGPRSEVIQQSRSQLAESQAQVKLVQAQLEHTKVVAPVSGKVALRNARVGDVTSNSTALFEIIEAGRLELRLSIPETLIGQIKAPQEVKVTADSDPNLIIEGTVREIVPLIDQDSRQAIVRVDLPPNTELKPGMFLRGGIVTSSDQGMTIPMEAVLPQSDGTAVTYLVVGESVKAQPIELGQILPGNKVEVIEGLTPGQQVVVKGAAYLKDGDRIEITKRS